jgi:hypothetical protein
LPLRGLPTFIQDYSMGWGWAIAGNAAPQPSMYGSKNSDSAGM